MRMKEYDLSALFDIQTTQGIDKNKVNLDDTADIDFIGRTSANYGIQGRVDRLSYEPNPRDCFSLVQIGETIALWRENEWYASQNIFILKPLNKKIKSTFLYFQSVINKEMSVYGKDYNSYPTLKKLLQTHVSLPVTTKYIPDFETMSALTGGGYRYE